MGIMISKPQNPWQHMLSAWLCFVLSMISSLNSVEGLSDFSLHFRHVELSCLMLGSCSEARWGGGLREDDKSSPMQDSGFVTEVHHITGEAW